MKTGDLIAANARTITPKELLRRTRSSVEKLARYFGRAKAVTNRVPLEDLESIASAELWLATRDYRFRCQQCTLSATTKEDLEQHEAQRHAQVLGPWPPIVPFVQGRVGRALYRVAKKALNEANAHRHVSVDDVIIPTRSLQLEDTAFGQMVERAERELSELHAEVMVRIVEGGEVWTEEAGEVGKWLERIERTKDGRVLTTEGGKWLKRTA